MKTYFTFMKESHTLYHNSYTDAVNAALQKHSDLKVSPEDRDTHIAMGPRKPAEGETVKHHIPATDKNGDKHIIHIQVYNKGGNKPFELNTYSSKKGVSFSSVSKKKVAEETEMRHSSDSLGDHMALKDYAKKHGGIDKHDLLTAASHMAFGNMDHLKKHLKALDTDVRDKALEYVARRHYAELGYSLRKEEVEQVNENIDKTIERLKKQYDHHDVLYGRSQEARRNRGSRTMSPREEGLRNKRNTILDQIRDLERQKKESSTIKEEADQIDEQVSFKKTVYGDHHIHHFVDGNDKRVGEIRKKNDWGSLGYSVRIGGKEVSSEKSLKAAKESAKYHLTSNQIHEAHMSEKDAESLAQKHVNAAKSAKEAGDLEGHAAHADASNDIRDMILKHTDSAKGIPSGKIQRTAKNLFGKHFGESADQIDEASKKSSMAKVKLSIDDADIGYKVTDVGPGGEETIRKKHNYPTNLGGGMGPIGGKYGMPTGTTNLVTQAIKDAKQKKQAQQANRLTKEEVDQIDELSRTGVLQRYSDTTRYLVDRGVEKPEKREKMRLLAGKKRWGGTGGISSAKVSATNEALKSNVYDVMDREREHQKMKDKGYVRDYTKYGAWKKKTPTTPTTPVKKETNEEADQIEGMDHVAVNKFASEQHDVWRKGFDPEGTGKKRIKKNSDGSEGNINVPFEKLHPDWQKENLSAGKAALQAVRKHPNDMESAADHVHREWMKRNPKADYNAAQHVPYSELPEVEKQKDRDHVDTMKSQLRIANQSKSRTSER